jgi:phosphatidylinositol kinase/protein kinase (PI-3  family)
MNGPAFQAISNFFSDQIEKGISSAKAGSASLKNYSPWLANFNGSEYTENIEIPGQYASITRPPIPSEHATIRLFHPTLLIMSSMRRPKRITMIESLGKESLWLAKSGEDLRMDQRFVPGPYLSGFNKSFRSSMECLTLIRTASSMTSG